MSGRERRELASTGGAFCQVELRSGRLDEVAKAIENGIYRVPARVLAACLILEMLR